MIQQEIQTKRATLSAEDIKRLYWEEERSIPEIARATGIPKYALYELMDQFKIPRRSFSESNYAYSNKTRPRFSVKKVLSVEDEKLKVAGIMLYWAEGAR